MKVRVSVDIDIDVLEAVRAAMEATGKSRNSIVNAALREYLTKEA